MTPAARKRREHRKRSAQRRYHAPRAPARPRCSCGRMATRSSGYCEACFARDLAVLREYVVLVPEPPSPLDALAAYLKGEPVPCSRCGETTVTEAEDPICAHCGWPLMYVFMGVADVADARPRATVARSLAPLSDETKGGGSER